MLVQVLLDKVGINDEKKQVILWIWWLWEYKVGYVRVSGNLQILS